MNIIQTEQAPAAIGPYSQAIVHDGLVYCSQLQGLCAGVVHGMEMLVPIHLWPPRGRRGCRIRQHVLLGEVSEVIAFAYAELRGRPHLIGRIDAV